MLRLRALSSRSAAELAQVTPLIDPDRRSVKRILDQLIDRRRLYGYTIEVDGDSNEVNVRVFTYTKDEIDLPSGATVPANANQDAISNASDITAIINAINLVPGFVLPIYAADMNRSDVVNGQDILRLIDLLNGAGEFSPWITQTLPPCPSGGPGR